MKAHQLSLSLLLAAVGTWHATAQEQTTPKQKLIEMRKTIEGLDWQKIDFAALSPIERCRTLMVLNHALNELDAAAVAEADLLGAFLEEKNLGEAYVANPPADAPLARNFEDARKIASALLKGPMSKSRYSTELSSTDARGLEAYEKVYDASARRRWESFSNSSRELRGMVAFLRSNGRLKEYMTWVPQEATRRQDEYEQTAAAQRTTSAPTAGKKPDNPADTPSSQQQEQDRADSEPAQRALYAAQQPTTTTVNVNDDDDWYPGWYNGKVDNMKRSQPMHCDSNYQAAAHARVEQRQQKAQSPQNSSKPQKEPPKSGGGRRP